MLRYWSYRFYILSVVLNLAHDSSVEGKRSAIDAIPKEVWATLWSRKDQHSSRFIKSS